MEQQEILYTMALTRLTGFNFQTALHLYRQTGGGRAVYDHRHDIGDIVPDVTPRTIEALRDWSSALARAEEELSFMERHHVEPLCLADERYPRRLAECDDAPLVLYYRGTADLNQRRILSIVGTRHATIYGQDLVRRFLTRLRELCPQVLVVSGLAYGIDIQALRQALTVGYETIGVLAHGLDTIYPSAHRETAVRMATQGGLLTEYMTSTQPIANNFRQRNRIVAGMSDATVVVESAAKGGSLITARIAQEYGRDVTAFPGPVGALTSEGCNNLIRDNRAALIASADDFIAAVGWQSEVALQEARTAGIERSLFPDLTADEQAVVDLLSRTNDLQLNVISVRTNQTVGALTATLFQLEMKGIVKPLAGGTYHLLK